MSFDKSDNLKFDRLDDYHKARIAEVLWKQSPIGIALVTQHDVISDTNKNFGRICGVTPAHYIGKTFQDITHPDYLQEDMENAHLVRDAEIPAYLLEKRYRFTMANGIRIEPLINIIVGAVFQGRTFLFYVSQIVQSTKENEETADAHLLSPKGWWTYENIKENKEKIAGFTIAAGTIVMALRELIKAW